MKRIGLILATLIGIVAFALLANRTTRIPVTRAVNTNQESKPTASPDFTLKDLEDHDVSLSQFKGKVVLVNFWATWCGPCRIDIIKAALQLLQPSISEPLVVEFREVSPTYNRSAGS